MTRPRLGSRARETQKFAAPTMAQQCIGRGLSRAADDAEEKQSTGHISNREASRRGRSSEQPQSGPPRDAKGLSEKRGPEYHWGCGRITWPRVNGTRILSTSIITTTAPGGKGSSSVANSDIDKIYNSNVQQKPQ